jgi:SAM-dependent methyltransferase
MTTAQSNAYDIAAAYEGLEDPGSFPDRRSLDLYRASLLARTVPQAEFLAERLRPAARVLEIGCGNGRLLIELAERGVVEAGIGLDLASSRIEFARRWANDAGIASLRFDVADVLQKDLPVGPFAAVCCVTGTFAYFEAIAAGNGAEMASRLAGVLEPGGLLCLELYPHPEYRRLLKATDGRTRIWTELPAEDPWRFYLSALSLDEDSQVLTHEKTFIHRTNGIIDSGRRERLYLYTEKVLTKLLVEAGFEGIGAYEGWGAEPYAGGEVMVVTAFTPSPT